MNVELYAMLNLVFYQVLSLIIIVCYCLLKYKNKSMAKKTAEKLGLVFIGIIEALLVVLLCFLFS